MSESVYYTDQTGNLLRLALTLTPRYALDSQEGVVVHERDLVLRLGTCVPAGKAWTQAPQTTTQSSAE